MNAYDFSLCDFVAEPKNKIFLLSLQIENSFSKNEIK
jgi:hypothetical protein